MRVFCLWSREVITTCSTWYLKSCRGCGLGELAGSCCIEFLRELVVGVRPQQASVLACVVHAGTSKGHACPIVLEGARCWYCGTEWSCRIVIVKILHSSEGGDIEKCAQISKQFFRICNCSSLSHLCLYILHAYIVYVFICLIYLCLIDIFQIICSHLYSTKRAIVAPQLLI